MQYRMYIILRWSQKILSYYDVDKLCCWNQFAKKNCKLRLLKMIQNEARSTLCIRQIKHIFWTVNAFNRCRLTRSLIFYFHIFEQRLKRVFESCRVMRGVGSEYDYHSQNYFDYLTWWNKYKKVKAELLKVVCGYCYCVISNFGIFL